MCVVILHPLLEIVHVVMQQLSASIILADEKMPCAFLWHVTVGAVGARSRVDAVELFARGAEVGGLLFQFNSYSLFPLNQF